ncbi:MAG: DUF4251 domain-containing protein [Flavobacteriaceae bacterium]
MKNLKILVCLIIVPLCSYSQSGSEKKLIRAEQAKLRYETTQQLIASGNFVFVADRTIPTQGNRISLINIYNQIKFENGEAEIMLPFFGIVRNATGYSHNPAVEYDGVVDDYKVQHNALKRKSTVEFSFKSGFETHMVRMTTRSNGYTSVMLKSTGRSNSVYDGYIRPIAEASN